MAGPEANSLHYGWHCATHFGCFPSRGIVKDLGKTAPERNEKSSGKRRVPRREEWRRGGRDVGLRAAGMPFLAATVGPDPTALHHDFADTVAALLGEPEAAVRLLREPERLAGGAGEGQF